MTNNDSLIILAQNPEKGRVKEKFAKEIGEEQALVVHHKLLQYAKEITKRLNAHKSIFYSDFIDNNDLWDNMIYDKHLQQGSSQGEIMTDAFTAAFASGKDRVVIIGTDCMELESYMIKEAFTVLENNDVVLGPSTNGGYYLLGLSRFYPTLFEGKTWDSPDLLMDTILDLKKMNAKYYLLKTLSDIQTSGDLSQLSKIHDKPQDWF